MAYVSMLLYAVSHHPVTVLLGTPAVLAGLAGVAALLGWKRASGVGVALAVAMFALGFVNVFAGGMVNAAFLNAVGVEGQAVIIEARETSSRLNEQPIWAYEAVVRTADGQDADTRFTTATAAIWPIRNAILIPPRGETFAVKYTPGFPRNIVILSDRSPSGRRRLLAERRAPVDRAERRLAASPDNAAFRQDYRHALADFLREHGDTDAAVTADFERRLADLDAPAAH